jgi:hypothetical protein
MKTIYKYPLQITDRQSLILKEGAQILSAQSQYDGLFAWVMVDTAAPRAIRKINIYGTGNPIQTNETLKFISTVQMGAFVWHIFEVLP